MRARGYGMVARNNRDQPQSGAADMKQSSKKPKHVIHCHYKKAREFVDAITPRGPIFGRYSSGIWIFRGHAREEYRLIPLSLRELQQPILHDLARTSSAIRGRWDT